MKRFLADTFALIVFSTVAGAFVEFLIAGLSASQVLQARLVAVPVILLTARPYGLYRDWLFRAFRARAGGPLRAALIDILAFVSFQVPVYALNLALAGATLGQIAASVASAVVILLISGRPYGLFLDWCRRLFGVAETE
jgi:hypothetical protein